MRYCLRAPPEKQITTPLQMYEYVVQNCESIRVFTDVKKHEKKLKRRFSVVKTLENTRQYHCYIPVKENSFQAKITSFDTSSKKVNLLLPNKNKFEVILKDKVVQ
ncbi:unnamed protein product [Brassicogethes aeneus]|uniref:Uncharacterized protein n=1 Tax=Brassicogethes aeneus TaxID=1431903 RepID=A0A9P0ASG6_BRAAE|nr:unnamed protein product [Brassicogethes aeneus]